METVLRRPQTFYYNNCFLSFSQGNPCLWELMENFVANFNNGKWGHQGPGLITRVLKYGNGACRNQSIHVHNASVLAPIALRYGNWPENKVVFEKVGVHDITRLQTSGSVAIHVYNKVTHGRTSPALCPTEVFVSQD